MDHFKDCMKPINMADFAQRVCMRPGSVTEAEHRALRDSDITNNGKYRLVRIDGQTIPGSDVTEVVEPSQDKPFWSITLRSGTVYKTR